MEGDKRSATRAGYIVGAHGALFSEAHSTIEGDIRTRPIIENMEGDLVFALEADIDAIALRREENNRRNMVHHISTLSSPRSLIGYHLPEWMRSSEPTQADLTAENREDRF